MTLPASFMNILPKISFMVLISLLISCNRQDKLIDTWILAPIDTVFTSWDISKDKIVSNLLGPDKLIAKYKIQGNKIVIDSGAVLLDDFYISENELLQFKLTRDKLKIKLFAVDSVFLFDFERKPDLLVNERLLPDNLLNIDLPYIEYAKAIDAKLSDWIFLGFPKDKLLGKFENKMYMQLNDFLTNTGNSIVREFVSFDSKVPIILFCDRKVEMIALDSLRMNLFNHKILFAGLNEDLEFGYLETYPSYYCNCVAISNMPPPRPIQELCKHRLILDKKIHKNHFRIDTINNYYFQDTLIKISDVPKIIDLISTENQTDTIIFIQYDDLTKFEHYIKLYSILESSISGLDKGMTIIDINEKDLDYIEKASW